MSLSDLQVGDAVCYGDQEGTVERILKNGFIAIGGMRFTSSGEKYGSGRGGWRNPRLEVLTPELKQHRDLEKRFTTAEQSAFRSIEFLERHCRHMRNARYRRFSVPDMERLERIAAALEQIVREEGTGNG